ncbi:MAG TPA: hypothetical protein VII92_01395 [Anaerolineae bacterium]
MANYTHKLCARLASASGRAERKILMELVFESLSPQHRIAYCLVKTIKGISTPDIAKRLMVRQNHAGTVMSYLLEIGMVKRAPVSEGGVFFYRWFVNPRPTPGHQRQRSANTINPSAIPHCDVCDRDIPLNQLNTHWKGHQDA